MHDFPFITQKQLGEVFGVENFEMGRMLKHIGFRDQYMQMNPELIKQGIIREENGITGWHREKTIAALEKAGFKRPIDRNSLPTGPFTIETEGGGKCLMDSAGKVCMRIYGGEFGEKIAEIMRLAFEKGGMFCPEWWERVCPKAEEGGKSDWRDRYENM